MSTGRHFSCNKANATGQESTTSVRFTNYYDNLKLHTARWGVKGNEKKRIAAQSDNYQSAGKTEASWVPACFAQSFMCEKNPSLTGRATWQDVLKLSAHTSSEKRIQTWILKLYLPLETGLFATSRNNLINTPEFRIFWRKEVQNLCKRLALLRMFSLWLSEDAAFAAALKISELMWPWGQ